MGALYLAVKKTNRARLRSTAIKSGLVHEAMDHSPSIPGIDPHSCNSGAFAQGQRLRSAALWGDAGISRLDVFVLTASDSTQFAWEGDRVIGKNDNSYSTIYGGGAGGRSGYGATGNYEDELYDSL